MALDQRSCRVQHIASWTFGESGEHVARHDDRGQRAGVRIGLLRRRSGRMGCWASVAAVSRRGGGRPPAAGGDGYHPRKSSR